MLAREVCSQQGLPSGKTSYSEPNMLVYYQNLTDLGKDSTQFQPILTVLFHLNEEGIN